MNPAEQEMPIYPTQIASHRPGDLTAWREGVLGERRVPDAYGQRLTPYKSGVFGPSLGDAETGTMVGGGDLRAYRDGLFSTVAPAEAPSGHERLTAFHSGIFGGAVGQDEEAPGMKYDLLGLGLAFATLALVGFVVMR